VQTNADANQDSEYGSGGLLKFNGDFVVYDKLFPKIWLAFPDI